MQVLLRLGKTDQATDAAMVAVQNTLQRDTILRKIVAAVERAGLGGEAAESERLSSMASGFKRLIGNGLSGVGGGR